MKQIMLTVFFLMFITVINGVDIIDCGSKVGKFTDVKIVGCDMSKAACELKRNTNATISIDFIPSSDAKAATTVIHGIINHLPIPFPVSNPDACSDNGLHCPLKANTKYEYQAVLEVLHTYPRISLKVKWELQNERNDDIVCIELPAKIV